MQVLSRFALRGGSWGHSDSVLRVVFSRWTKAGVSGNTTSEVKLWDVTTAGVC